MGARARDRGAGVLRNPKNNNAEATHNGTPDGVERVTLRDGRTEDRSRDWYCKCGERNFARRFECHLCGGRRDMPHITAGPQMNKQQQRGASMSPSESAESDSSSEEKEKSKKKKKKKRKETSSSSS